MIRLIAAGDIAMRGLEDYMDERAGAQMLKPILGELRRADVRLANWENAVSTRGAPIVKAGPNLRALPRNLGVLRAGGFECALLANNHMGDYGPEGVLETLECLDELGIHHVGAGRNAHDALVPLEMRVGDETLVVLNACEYEYGIALRDKPGAAAFEPRAMRFAVQEARGRADAVLFVMHGGNEHCPIPSPVMVRQLRDLADAGADAVICMHSHCPQGFEIYNGIPIVYGTGNFIFQSAEPREPGSMWYRGYLPLITLDMGRPGTLEPIPYKYDPELRIVTPYRGEVKRQMLSYLQTLSDAFLSPERHRALYAGWCMHIGSKYANGLRYTSEYLTSLPDASMCGFRDLLTCQSHNELLTNFARMLTDGDRDWARAQVQSVLALQRLTEDEEYFT